MRRLFIAPALVLLTASQCGHVASPGEKVVIQDHYIDVQRPCPVVKPTRPAPLARPLPLDPGALVSLMAAKLKEYVGPGGYVERAESAISTCTKP